MKTRRAILIAFLAAPTWLYCQTDSASVSRDLFDLSLEELMNLQVTTASKTASKSDLAPAVIEVITSEMIQARGYQHLAHILNDIPDNHEDRSNWAIGEPTHQNVGFGFRFDTGQNILILFNGQRLNAFLPGNRFGGEEYLLKNIDRIEIIRGPGSSLYGTGAFTCVVNIITKKLSESEHGDISVNVDYVPTSKGAVINGASTTKLGKVGTISTALRYSTERGQLLTVNNSLFGDKMLRDGVHHTIDGELFINHGSFNIFSKFTNQSRNTFTGFNSVSPADLDQLTLKTYAYSLGTDKTFKLSDQIHFKISAGWHQDNWTESALIPQFKVSPDGSKLITDESGSLILDTLTLFRNGQYIQSSFFIDGQGADTRSLDAELQITYNYSRNNNIVIGTYLADDRVIRAVRPTELYLDPLLFVPYTIITDATNNWLVDVNASRKTVAAFGQIDYNVTPQLAIVTGFRLDLYSGTGILREQKYNELNPRASVIYSIDNNHTAKILYGTATRIPNGFETLSSVSILGDPNNRPERIRTYQLQWITNWSSNLRTEMAAFRSAISNRLETNADISDQLRAQGFVGQFVNTAAPDNQVNHGIDMKVISRIKKGTITLNCTQYFGSDDGHGRAIPYIPNTMINLDYTMKLDVITLSGGLNYRGGFTKQITDPRPVVKDYLIARANIIFQPVNSPFAYRINTRNLFNTKYAFPSSSTDFQNHFPSRGIEISIGITYSPTWKNL